MLPHTVCTLLTILAVSSPPEESLVYKEVPATDALPKTSMVQTADEAQRLVMQSLGISNITEESISTTLVKLLENRTPFLGDTLLDKAVWHAVVRNWQGDVKTERNTYKEQYARALDVYLDPLSGQVLEVRTRWPDGVPAIGDEPSSQAAALQMSRSGREKYHSFASEKPKVSFHGALESVAHHLGSPFAAKQIIGHYVIWSKKNAFWSEPRAAWIITLRGVEMARKRNPGVTKYNRRVAIDATTGEYLGDTNIPRNKKVKADGD